MLSGISVCTVSAEEKSTEIHIVHTNDIHGYYKSTSSGQIGFDAVKTIADKENADLILDAGDTFTDSHLPPLKREKHCRAYGRCRL